MNGNDRFTTLTAKRHLDGRGFFQELGQGQFHQVNWSRSHEGVLRGLHYARYPKLVTVVHGKILDVAVDCRPSSPDFGKSFSAVLSRGVSSQVYVPAEFAHGFYAEEDSDVIYMQPDVWRDDEIVIHPHDPHVNVQWPTKSGIMSVKDSNGLSWEDFKWLLNDLHGK